MRNCLSIAVVWNRKFRSHFPAILAKRLCDTPLNSASADDVAGNPGWVWVVTWMTAPCTGCQCCVLSPTCPITTNPPCYDVEESNTDTRNLARPAIRNCGCSCTTTASRVSTSSDRELKGKGKGKGLRAKAKAKTSS